VKDFSRKAAENAKVSFKKPLKCLFLGFLGDFAPWREINLLIPNSHYLKIAHGFHGLHGFCSETERNP
jgi:hypothetical protein